MVAPDGSAFDSFVTGIYMVGPDGRAAFGWPYLLPADTHNISCCLGDTPGRENHRPVRTESGRVYLPRRDERHDAQHDDLMCLLADGTICPGWPVRFADGTWIDGWWTDEQGAYHEGFAVDERGVVHVRLNDFTGAEPWSAYVQPDGTVFHRVGTGETTWGIAEAFGVTRAALLDANPQVTDPSLIVPGQVLTIPSRGATR